MTDMASDEQRRAQREYEEATRHVEELVKHIVEVGHVLRAEWRDIAIVGAEGFPTPNVLTAPLNLAEWPSRDDIIQALVSWHRARRAVDLNTGQDDPRARRLPRPRETT